MGVVGGGAETAGSLPLTESLNLKPLLRYCAVPNTYAMHAIAPLSEFYSFSAGPAALATRPPVDSAARDPLMAGGARQ